MDTGDYKTMNESVTPLFTEPEHYQVPISPIEYILANDLDFCVGNVIKYATRAGQKTYAGIGSVQSAIDDWKKVQHYAQFKIDQLREV